MLISLSAALSSSVNSYVFYFIPNNMIWTEAQTYCRKHHTDLATVNDKTDLDELLKTLPKGFKSNIWIGLYRTNAQPPWVFSDGSHSLFRPWLSGQPNNYDGIQHCVYTDPNGYWNDWTCTDQFAFICYGELLAAGTVQDKSFTFVLFCVTATKEEKKTLMLPNI